MKIELSVWNKEVISSYYKLIETCEAEKNQKVCLCVFEGEAMLANSKRAYVYEELLGVVTTEGFKFMIDDFKTGEKICLLRSIKVGRTIGSVIAVVREGNSFILNKSMFIGSWDNESDLARWNAEQQRLNFEKMSKAKMKDGSFDTRLRKEMQYIRAVYRRSDSITKQYLIAKMINYLNS